MALFSRFNLYDQLANQKLAAQRKFQSFDVKECARKMTLFWLEELFMGALGLGDSCLCSTFVSSLIFLLASFRYPFYEIKGIGD